METHLKIKHLAPYLPYGLNVKHNEGMRLIICGAFKKHNADDFFIYSLLNWIKDVKSTDAKPILRPLSDLTKEIEHNGEKLIPIDFINGDFASEIPKKIEWNQSVRNENLHFVLAEWISPKNLYGLFELLFEWHFDVFGLIEKGLAIDINTLK